MLYPLDEVLLLTLCAGSCGVDGWVFGSGTVNVPRARLVDEAGRTTEWRSQALRRCQRLTRKAEALIVSVYLAGTDTRRVKRALCGLFEDGDYLRAMVRAVVEATLEAEMTAALGAEKGERSEARLGYRSGSYPRTLITRVGTLERPVNLNPSPWRYYAQLEEPALAA